MTNRARLSKLERMARAARGTSETPVSDDLHDRAMETLAEALSEITGEPATRADVEQAIRTLHPARKHDKAAR